MKSIELATFKIDLSSLNKTLDKVKKEISKQKCKNCKHWDVEKPRKVAMCLQSKILGGQMYSASGLFTTKDFGCKLFEKKIKNANPRR
jgi:hypothetical protein